MDQKELETKITALDIKEKLLIIESDEAMPLAQLVQIRDNVRKLGGLGVLYLPVSRKMTAESIDFVIGQLQTMKQQLENVTIKEEVTGEPS